MKMEDIKKPTGKCYVCGTWNGEMKPGGLIPFCDAHLKSFAIASTPQPESASALRITAQEREFYIDKAFAEGQAMGLSRAVEAIEEQQELAKKWDDGIIRQNPVAFLDKQYIEQFEAGYDAGFNRPNTTNCDFRHFYSPEATKAWEKGNKEGLRAKDKMKNEKNNLTQ